MCPLGVVHFVCSFRGFFSFFCFLFLFVLLSPPLPHWLLPMVFFPHSLFCSLHRFLRSFYLVFPLLSRFLLLGVVASWFLRLSASRCAVVVVSVAFPRLSVVVFFPFPFPCSDHFGFGLCCFLLLRSFGFIRFLHFCALIRSF